MRSSRRPPRGRGRPRTARRRRASPARIALGRLRGGQLDQLAVAHDAARARHAEAAARAARAPPRARPRAAATGAARRRAARCRPRPRARSARRPSRSSSAIFSMWSSTADSSRDIRSTSSLGEREPGERATWSTCVAIDHRRGILGAAGRSTRSARRARPIRTTGLAAPARPARAPAARRRRAARRRTAVESAAGGSLATGAGSGRRRRSGRRRLARDRRRAAGGGTASRRSSPLRRGAVERGARLPAGRPGLFGRVGQRSALVTHRPVAAVRDQRRGQQSEPRADLHVDELVRAPAR